jgi:hypothetical protein
MKKRKQDTVCVDLTYSEELSQARPADTLPDMMQDYNRHAHTLSEKENAQEQVELLRGSEEDDGKQQILDEYPVQFANLAHSKASSLLTEMKTKKEQTMPEVYHHKSEVRYIYFLCAALGAST